LARLRFVARPEPIEREDSIPSQETLQDFGAFGGKEWRRDPGVFLPDLLFVFEKSGLALTEDAEIDVDQEFGVHISIGLMILCGHYELRNALAQFRAGICLREALVCQSRAPFFVAREPLKQMPSINCNLVDFWTFSIYKS
jgi:hypothetical protein